ncbi:unannotated protein [freshwater metagenome]|uniref:Unannotated protein n=1 Tax=freshwater metagenome TaxID=449393 RepID=A0A6J7U815_9ZZZZ
MMPIPVKAAVDVWPTASFTPLNETVPIVAKAIMMAKDRPMSPIRFITNAFLDAVAYAGF